MALSRQSRGGFECMAGPESRAMFIMLYMGELAGEQELQTMKMTKRAHTMERAMALSRQSRGGFE